MAAIVAFTATFGPIKVGVGYARAKPVGYTVTLIIATVVLAQWIASFAPTRTPLGSAVLEQYRTWYRRAASAPRADELLFAFALGGAAVLEGTHLAEVGALIRSYRGAGGGDGGGGGDGCGGCEGGGGVSGQAGPRISDLSGM